MRIAVTGARGFVGRNVVEAVARTGHQTLGIDKGGLTDVPPPGVEHVDADVTRPATLVPLLRTFQPDVVIHLAATTITAAQGPAPGIDINVAGTQCVLDAARQAGAHRCLVTSSTAVFGHAVFGTTDLDEQSPVSPTTAYGFTKVAAESLVHLSNTAHSSLSSVVVRLPALFGPWERETEHRVLMSAPRQLIAAAAGNVRVVLAEGGSRDWTYAPDVAAALVALATAEQLAHDTYHVGGGTTWNVRLLAELMVERGTPLDYTVADVPTIDYGDDLTQARVALNSRRVKDELGITFEPPDVACRRYLDWLHHEAAASETIEETRDA